MQLLTTVLTLLFAAGTHTATLPAESEPDSLAGRDSVQILIAQKDNRKSGYVNYGKKEYWWHDAHCQGFREKMMNSGYEYEWTISAQYDRASKRFQEDLAAVVLHGKTGYIDRNNRFIILPVLEEQKFPKGFSQGLSVVCVGDRYGYIDKRGNFIIEPQFERAEQFEENQIAHVRIDGKYGAIDLNGELLIPCVHTTPESMKIGKNQQIWKTADSLVAVRLNSGYYSKVQSRIRSAEQYAEARINDPGFRNTPPSGVSVEDSLGRFGLKRNGKWIHYPALDSIKVLSHGYFQTSLAGMHGIYDSFGRQIIRNRFHRIIFQPSAEVFIVKDAVGRHGLYDTKGRMVLPPCLDYIKDFVGGRAECMMQGVIGYIDRNGQVLTPGFHDDVINRSMLTSDVQLRMSILKNLITLKPTYAQAHNNLAACYTSIEKYKDAIPLLKLAHRLDPKDPVIAKNLQKAKDGRNDKILTATFVVVGVVASVALAAVAVVADVASVEGGGGGSCSSGSGSSGSGSSYGSSSSGKSSGSSGVSQSELQSQYDRAIDNIRKIKDSWSDHVGTHAEATNRQNLNEVKQTIRKIKSRASEKGYTLRTDSLENWNP